MRTLAIAMNRFCLTVVRRLGRFPSLSQLVSISIGRSIMSRTRLPALCTGLFLLLPLLGGCQRSQAPGEVGADVELNGAAYHISGPYSHANVAVFLLHAADQDDRDFLTLDEGLKADLVKVSEKDQERVNELLI